jgi:uncharacterized membrane protein YedE/YeeE
MEVNEVKKESELQPSYYDRLLKKEWSYTTGAVMVSAFAMALFAFSGIWGVSGPLATWGGKFLTLLGINADSWSIYNGSLAKYQFFGNKASITDIGLLMGALIACLLAAQWKIRNIKHWKQAAAAALGGLLMGVGAKMANGCNIGGLFSQLPQFSGAGWVFLLFVFLGATIGGRLLKFFMPPASNKRPNRKRLTAEQRKRNKTIQIAIGVALSILCLAVAFIVAPKYPNAPAFILIGVGIGYSMQRSRFCFTAAYRDPTLTGETKLTKAVLVAFALCTIAFFGFHISSYGADLSKLDPTKLPGNPINLSLLVGSFIFGIGAVLAGGCASGTFIRMGEGYVQNLIAFVFFVTGSTIGSFVTGGLKGTFMTVGPKVYLPAVFGGFVPALLIQLAALMGLWILADWWEKRKHAMVH